MADTWYARVNNKGIVIMVFCDDNMKPTMDDIQLNTKWYWGRLPGIGPTNFIGEYIYKVVDGRLVPQTNIDTEIAAALRQKRTELNSKNISSIASKSKKDALPAAKVEAEAHLNSCINPWEISHTVLKGY